MGVGGESQRDGNYLSIECTYLCKVRKTGYINRALEVLVKSRLKGYVY